MKYLVRCVLLLFVLTVIASQAHARIYILIDEASTNKFPIAVPEFLTASGGRSGTTSKLTTLLKKDLNIAGIFQVMDEDSFAVDDRDVERIDFNKWQAIEAQALVKGVVDRDSVQIRLYDIAERRMLLGKQYTLSGKNYIDAIHRFVDSLMKSLTGIRGPFESRIAGSCGKPFKRHIGWFEMDGERSGGLTGGSGNQISPSWSPDGGRVTYTSFATRFPEVYISGRQVTSFNSTTITPVFTPDGGHLVVASAFSGDTELYMVSTGGKVISQITHSPNIDLAPAFSPDGGQIAFSSERTGGLHLFVTDVGGGGARRLTYTGYQNDQADWAPDGTKIVFTGRDTAGAFDIFIMDSDGSNIQRLTRGMGSNESPTFAPDSRYVVFSSTKGGLYVMLADGMSEAVIPKSGGCLNPEWGPWLHQDEGGTSAPEEE